MSTPDTEIQDLGPQKRDCPTCDNKISENAEACPQCGEPFPENKERSMGNRMLSYLGIGIYGFCSVAMLMPTDGGNPWFASSFFFLLGAIVCIPTIRDKMKDNADLGPSQIGTMLVISTILAVVSVPT